jgi:hypothetical protein
MSLTSEARYFGRAARGVTWSFAQLIEQVRRVDVGGDVPGFVAREHSNLHGRPGLRQQSEILRPDKWGHLCQLECRLYDGRRNIQPEPCAAVEVGLFVGTWRRRPDFAV